MTGRTSGDRASDGLRVVLGMLGRRPHGDHAAVAGVVGAQQVPHACPFDSSTRHPEASAAWTAASISLLVWRGLSRLSRVDPRQSADPFHKKKQDFVGEPTTSRSATVSRHTTATVNRCQHPKVSRRSDGGNSAAAPMRGLRCRMCVGRSSPVADPRRLSPRPGPARPCDRMEDWTARREPHLRGGRSSTCPPVWSSRSEAEPIASLPMRCAPAVTLLALCLASCPTQTSADSEMKQSPLLFHRAGPSCQPGNLGGEDGAGFGYRVGPCAGPDAAPVPDGAQRTHRSSPRRRG